jgi:hypothetical protein
VDVQLEEQSIQGGGDGLRGAQGKQDVAAGADEVEDLLGSQVGAKSWDIALLAWLHWQFWGGGLLGFSLTL